MRMPWGMYAGYEISSLSSDYLKLLIESSEDDEIREEAEEEYQIREDGQFHW